MRKGFICFIIQQHLDPFSFHLSTWYLLFRDECKKVLSGFTFKTTQSQFAFTSQYVIYTLQWYSLYTYQYIVSIKDNKPVCVLVTVNNTRSSLTDHVIKWMVGFTSNVLL